MTFFVSASRLLCVGVGLAVVVACSSGESLITPTSAMQQSILGLRANGAYPASVKYTPTNVVCKVHPGHTCSFAIDMDNDGTTDFTVSESIGNLQHNGHCFIYGAGVSVEPASPPGVVDVQPGWAAKMIAGQWIDSGQSFDPGTPILAQFGVFPDCHTYSNGVWGNARHRYLGLKFPILGKTHYGWAQLSVILGPFTLTTKMTGYAYQTGAGKPIKAGQI